MMGRLEFAEIDPATIAAEVEMLRAEADKAILLVEGAADGRLLLKFADESSCELVIAHGKYNALEAMKIIGDRSLVGVVCIVDTDYDTFLGLDPTADNIFVTDEHDFEAMMVRSSALSSVMREMGSRPKWTRFVEQGGDLEEMLLRIARPLGLVRLYSIEHEQNLKFEGLSYKFVKKADMSAELTSMIQEVYNNSCRSHCETIYEAHEYVVGWRRDEYDPWRLCCGHDLTAVLGRALQTYLGNHNSGEVSSDAIESRLRLAYDAEAFTRTALFASIRTWEEKSDEGYRVLRAELSAPPGTA